MLSSPIRIGGGMEDTFTYPCESSIPSRKTEDAATPERIEKLAGTYFSNQAIKGNKNWQNASFSTQHLHHVPLPTSRKGAKDYTGIN